MDALDVEAQRQSRGWGLGWTVATIFVAAVLFNYPWELAQSLLYVGMENSRALAKRAILLQEIPAVSVDRHREARPGFLDCHCDLA
jgi:hypothetical protein